MKRLSCGVLGIESIGPFVNDRVAVDVIEVGHDAILEFPFRGDAHVAQQGAGHFREEAFDEVEPGAVFGREDELETARGLRGEPGFGLLGDGRRMIVEDRLDRRAAARPSFL